MLSVGLTRRRIRLLLQWWRDSLRPTWGAAVDADADTGGMDVPVLPPPDAVADPVVQHHLEHRFDLLGSGWVQVKPGMRCRGLMGWRYDPPNAPGGPAGRPPASRGNLAEAIRIASLLDDGYRPIDWHVDFKSGWRWDPTTWYRRVRTAPAPGADIKVPWELARMQHLPQLALAYASPASAWHRDQRVLFEFRNQVLDFIAANPPRYGVNWKCTMDVGIRAANWVLAHGLLSADGARFDGAFQAVFTRSIREHGRHIFSNLEKINGRRANHFLGNLAGLVFCAAYLPNGREANEWLAFGRQQLQEEMEYQFLPDGGHFEGSTAYHRFALEMMAYPAAVLRGLGPRRLGYPEGAPVFPDWWWARLGRASRFLRTMRGPGGALMQVGDNDSGRLFKLSVRYARMDVAEARRKYANLEGYRELEDDAIYWMEDPLDAEPTLAVTGALLGLDHDLQAEESAEARVIQALTRGAPRPPATRAAEEERPTRAIREPAPEPGPSVRREYPASGGDLSEGLVLFSFPDFGCFLFRSPRLYLLVRAWVRQPGYTAHLHDDQLAITLWLDGEPLIRDPGTFLYTPAPAERNRYRGVAAHDTPRPADRGEPADPGHGVFVDPDATPCSHLTVSSDGFFGRHKDTARSVSILPDRIVVEDWPGRSDPRPLPIGFSPGYGVQENPGP